MPIKTIAGFAVVIIALFGLYIWISGPQKPDAPATPPPHPPVIMSPALIQKNWSALMQVASPPRGNIHAAYTLLEIGDFQCPDCGRARPKVEKLLNDSGGKVSLYFINFPLPMIHKNAITAAEASLAGEAQGKFWDMYDMLYSHQDELIPSEIEYYASSIHGLDIKKFTHDLQTHAEDDKLQQQQMMDAQIQMMSTPTFILRGPDGKITYYVGDKGQKGQPGLVTLIKSPPWEAPKLQTASAGHP